MVVRTFPVRSTASYRKYMLNPLLAGFGLGALNDADEDDIDIYESASGMKNRVAFDRLDHDEDTVTIGKPSGSKVPTVSAEI